jgi:DNA-binding NarL/FixJ family response regulator
MNLELPNVKVMIVDDHRLIRDGLSSLLENVEGIKVVGEASNGDELLTKLTGGLRPDVILMDVRMPDKNGIELTRMVTKNYPGVRVIGLTMFESEQYITGMLQAGAMGYLLKNTGKLEIVQAIRTVAENRTYFSENVISVVLSKYMQQGGSHSHSGEDGHIGSHIPDPSNVHLTRREKEILKLIVNELTNHEIADKLFISPRTVETHRRNLIQKLGVKNTIGLIKFALNSGLID